MTTVFTLKSTLSLSGAVRTVGPEGLDQRVPILHRRRDLAGEPQALPFNGLCKQSGRIT